MTPASLAAVGIHGIPRRGADSHVRIVPGSRKRRGRGGSLITPFLITAEAQRGGVLGPLYHPDGCSICISLRTEEVSLNRPQRTHSPEVRMPCTSRRNADSPSVRPAKPRGKLSLVILPNPTTTYGADVYKHFSVVVTPSARRLSRIRSPLEETWSNRWGRGGVVVRLLASRQGEQCLDSRRGRPRIRMWELCRTMPLVGGFSRRSPISPALAFQRCSILTSLHPFTLLSSRSIRDTSNEIQLKLLPATEKRRCTSTKMCEMYAEGVHSTGEQSITGVKWARDTNMKDLRSAAAVSADVLQSADAAIVRWYRRYQDPKNGTVAPNEQTEARNT
ncbi:hypothetical protein PR048_017702 [Dryococelus australis]|uniref:Uncharacterized protein n=1 Tax=Dryococelus australis TaxID=614101 RepID=A0ABQ9HAU9_9NEOP|nr:hypothetical protein PR048_017702 [Dryococelus australis]